MKLFLSTIFAFLIFCLPVKAQQNGEGAGILVSDVDGALPKGLFFNQPRSEITYLLENMPASAPFRSLQEIKRNVMLSTYDTGSIENDVSIEAGQDLLTLRLVKLIEMGLWDDAFKLYSKGSDDPGQNDRLAEIGVLLALHKKGLAAACLEQKAFGERFDTDFFEHIDLICRKELAGEEIISTQFPNSPVLKSIYTEPDFSINASSVETLKKLTFLEMMLLVEKEKISYSNFTLDSATHPKIVKIYLEDKNFPTDQKDELRALADSLIIENITEKDNLDDITADAIQEMDQNELISYVTNTLEFGQEIAPEALQKLAETAPPNPQNIFYLQLINELSSNKEVPEFTPEEVAQSISAFSSQFTKEVNILKRWLDKPDEFSNNPAKVYEKQISSKPDGSLEVTSDDWTAWLGNTTASQLAGLSLLIVLNNNKNIGVRSESMINDLRYVGLIEQAHQIARDITVRLMRSNK